MTQSPKKRSGNNSHKDIKPITRHEPTQSQVKGDWPQNENAQNAAFNTKADKPISVNILSYQKKRDWQSIIANIVAMLACAIAFGLAIVTYRLYKIASNQAQTSKDAADAAKAAVVISDSTFNATKRYNDSSLIEQEKVFQSNGKSAEKTFKFQDSSFREAQKELEIENRPFVVIANIRIDSAIAGSRLHYTADINNAGKQPAYIIKSGYEFITSSDTAYKDIASIKEKKDIINIYLTNGATIPIRSQGVVPLIENDVNAMNTGKYYVYLIGFLKYKGFSKKLYTFNFSYRVNLKPPHDMKTIVSTFVD
ncbi:MAG: hypothetical protein JWQ79_903 [Mucilaginibacter sp.]|nr:hypothetical protein [Mucilaginibacter sp.]